MSKAKRSEATRGNAEHTPTTWRVDKDGDIFIIIGPAGVYIAACDDRGDDTDNEDNAAFIVRACNAHDELVDFVETVAMGNTDVDRLAELAKGILKKATGDKFLI